MNARTGNEPVATVTLDGDTAAYQRFIGQMRKLWAGPLYRRLRDEAKELGDGAGFETRLQALPTHQFFGWFEYNLQNMKYSSRRGIAAAVETHREKLEQELARPLSQGRLTENPDLAAPDYYQENDFHQHPGGLGGDAIAAVVYREGAGAAAGVVGKAGLHNRFAKAALGDRKPKRVLDIGCGFGRSTQAFADLGPAAGKGPEGLMRGAVDEHMAIAKAETGDAIVEAAPAAGQADQRSFRHGVTRRPAGTGGTAPPPDPWAAAGRDASRHWPSARARAACAGSSPAGSYRAR